MVVGNSRNRRISDSRGDAKHKGAMAPMLSDVFFIDPYNDFITLLTITQVFSSWFAVLPSVPALNAESFSMATMNRNVAQTKEYCSWLVKKLITKEDPKHLHQTLGALSLMSFIYRYVLIEGPGLGFGRNLWIDILTIIVHTLLAFSSQIFHVLKSRILSRPLIIYEEYRLHAMTFTMRGTMVYLFSHLADYLQWGPKSNVLHFGLFILVMAHHVMADYITKHHGSTEHTAVRVTGKTTDLLEKMVQRSYSFYQFLAIASHITLSARLADLGFNTHIAIQSSAFLMTLHRKGVIPWYVHAGVYALCLAASLYHIWLVHPTLYFFGLTFAAFQLRCQLGVNKYVIWALFSLVTSPFTSGLISSHF